MSVWWVALVLVAVVLLLFPVAHGSVLLLVVIGVWALLRLGRAARHLLRQPAPARPAVVVAWAARRLAVERPEWGQAMVSEIEHIQEPGARWSFVLGCVRVALFPPGDAGWSGQLLRWVVLGGVAACAVTALYATTRAPDRRITLGEASGALLAAVLLADLGLALGSALQRRPDEPDLRRHELVHERSRDGGEPGLHLVAGAPRRLSTAFPGRHDLPDPRSSSCWRARSCVWSLAWWARPWVLSCPGIGPPRRPDEPLQVRYPRPSPSREVRPTATRAKERLVGRASSTAAAGRARRAGRRPAG